MCRAANTQGSVSSNDLYLDIKCKWKHASTKDFPGFMSHFTIKGLPFPLSRKLVN